MENKWGLSYTTKCPDYYYCYSQQFFSVFPLWNNVAGSIQVTGTYLLMVLPKVTCTSAINVFLTHLNTGMMKEDRK